MLLYLCVILILLLQVGTVQATSCHQLFKEGVEHALRYDCTDGPRVNSSCTLLCREGYRPHGKNPFLCQENGRWDGYAVCKAITCSDLNTQDFHCTDGNWIGSNCEISCPSNKEAAGFNHTTCMENGEWSALPSCKSKTCPDLLLNSTQYICDKVNAVGSTCNAVACDEGFYLVGQRVIICEENKQWSGSGQLGSCIPVQSRSDTSKAIMFLVLVMIVGVIFGMFIICVMNKCIKRYISKFQRTRVNNPVNDCVEAPLPPRESSIGTSSTQSSCNTGTENEEPEPLLNTNTS